MKCTNCGTEHEAKFCPECGTPAAQVTNAESPPPAYQPPPVEQPPPSGEEPPTSQHIDTGAGAQPQPPMYPQPTPPPKKKKIIWYALGGFAALIALSVILQLTGVIEPRSSEPVEVVEEAPAVTPAADVASAPSSRVASSQTTNSSKPVDASVFVPVLENTLRENFGENMNVVHDAATNTITVSAWVDGIAYEASQAAAGDAQLLQSWNNLRDNLISSNQDIMQAMKEQGHSNAHLVFNVVNDINTDNTLLSLLDGVVVYDFINDSQTATAEESPTQVAATTGSQTQAVRKAEEYLRFTAFSRQGLIEQLESEGFSNEDAVFAVDNITVDWNKQAAAKAQSYLDFQAFSRQGLIDQLQFEGFTYEQAVYGADSVGL